MMGSTMLGCLFFRCCCLGRPRPTGAMLGIFSAGSVSSSSAMMWEWAMGIWLEFGDVARMMGSTMVGLSRVDRRCVVPLWTGGVMMAGAVPGVLFLVMRR